MKPNKLSNTVCELANLVALYLAEYVDLEHNAKAAYEALTLHGDEIRRRATNLWQFNGHTGDVPRAGLEEAVDGGLLDFSGFKTRLIPQRTEFNPGLRLNFLVNALADALCAYWESHVTPATDMQEYRFGLVRETSEQAARAQEENPGYRFTGLEEYLAVIFPGKKWVHDKALGGGVRSRPDYRCDELMLIVEFDGTPHYNDPGTIARDMKNQAIYEELGYTVVRIPYFVQLTREVILGLFSVDVGEDLVDPNIPSMGKEWKNTPAFCCTAGLTRMAREYDRFPQQYWVNIENLLKQNDNNLTGASILQWFSSEQNRYLGMQI